MTLVDQKTNGMVKVKAFPNAQLYDYHELADPLMSGGIDLALRHARDVWQACSVHALDWIDWGSPSLEQGWNMLRKLYEHPEFVSTLDSRFQELGVKLLFYAPNAVMRVPCSSVSLFARWKT